MIRGGSVLFADDAVDDDDDEGEGGEMDNGDAEQKKNKTSLDDVVIGTPNRDVWRAVAAAALDANVKKKCWEDWNRSVSLLF